MNIAEIVKLLGRSERDEQVEFLLKQEGVKLPLRRPKRNEEDVNVPFKGCPVEVVFTLADSVYPNDERFADGELVLHTIFVFIASDSKGNELLNGLPWGLGAETSRAEAKALFGIPQWSSPVVNNDRWQIDSVKVVLSFCDDESKLERITISIA